MKRIKSNRLSKQVRPVFELKPIRTVFGLLIACLTITFTLISPKTAVSDYSQPIMENISLSASAIQLTTTQSIRNPLEQPIVVNQYFHSGHLGVDFDGNIGNPVYPIMKGKILETVYVNYAYGYHILIDHTHNLSSLYAHLSTIHVKPGQSVDTNTIIGKIGTTGQSSGSHLHLEVIDQGKHINPLSFLQIIDP
jgi:murein DD-endopeptidase MepM/ murein hydrolase activator NlpD